MLQVKFWPKINELCYTRYVLFKPKYIGFTFKSIVEKGTIITKLNVKALSIKITGSLNVTSVAKNK